MYLKVDSAEIKQLKYDEKGLIPAIVQDVKSGTVLMLAYMNEESLTKTLQEGFTWFFSRSRQKLWQKGELSGNTQKVVAIFFDCDADTLLVQVAQKGVACHRGDFSCFRQALLANEGSVSADWAVLSYLEEIIRERQENRPPDSYTTYLLKEGIDKILKKVGEETAEVIIAAKGGQEKEIIYETADLLYHLLVMLRDKQIPLTKIWQELAQRHTANDEENRGIPPLKPKV